MMGTAVFTKALNLLPSGLKNMPLAGKSMGALKHVPGFKMLRWCGPVGASVWGVTKLYEWLENPENRTKIGTFPTKIGEQKEYFKKAAQTAGIKIGEWAEAGKDGAEVGLDYLKGDKMEQWMQSEDLKPGFIRCCDLPCWKNMTAQITGWEASIEQALRDKSVYMNLVAVLAPMKIAGLALTGGKISLG